MNRTVVVLIVLVAAGAARAGEWAIGEKRNVGTWLEVRRITESAWVVTEPRCFAANALLVRMADGSIVLCDAPTTAGATRQLLSFVRVEFGRPIDVAINSHFHADASGGNVALIEAGVTVYGSARTAELIAERGDALKQMMIENFANDPPVQEVFRKTRFVPPSKTFPEGQGLELRFGAEIVRVIDPGPAHSEDNCVIYFPAQRILFGGCMIRVGDSIGYVDDADVEHWPTAVRSLMDLQVDHVVPGHGLNFSPDLLKSTIDVVEAHRASSASAPAADKN
jgi:glyoxylase-like metal-dependent hydrolase (beta-lactamase superfamily II)